MGRLNKHTLSALFLLLFINVESFSQSDNFDILPKEEMYVTTNTDLFVVNETLFYKLYCFDKSNNTFSNISKMAYVLLINEEKEVVFEHKIKLNSGLACGDYFIPGDLKTGNYKLVSYTKWMNNNKETPFFSSDIYIINPFSSRRNTNYSSKNNIDSIAVKHTYDLKENGNNKIRINTDSDAYKTRCKVGLELINKDIFSNIGSYSISVRKVDSVEIIKANVYKPHKDIEKAKDKFSIPEIRGEIISGTVLLKEGGTNAPDKIVALSISGNKNIYKNAKTNKNGKFYFSLYENYRDGNLIIQLLDTDSDKYKIVLDDHGFKQLDKLRFNQVFLDPNIENWLINRSINNQVESSFFESKKDSIFKIDFGKEFYGEANMDFVLDDYTRFPTVKETFIEVIKGAGVRRVKGEQKIVLFNPDNEIERQIENLETFTLIDGIPIQDHEVILDFDTEKIERISIINQVFFYGPKIYNGILAIYTKENNFSLSYKVPHIRKAIVSPANKKLYFNQNYDKEQITSDRIPDFRTQLLWMPDSRLEENTQKIDFFTSDVIGLFEIKFEGYTKEGKHITFNKYITVE